eukprot:Hpha_TRINITY_DN37237_c0_g1::TRINITY_DN37237_c0_g1_i1::g.85247::m.85247
MGVFNRLLPDVKGRVVAFLLEYLGQYFEGLKREQIRVKLWEGDLKIEGVTLRRDAFDSLLENVVGIPWGLACGSVGALSLSVPWTSLRSEPVVVSVKDLHCVVAPKHAFPYDPQGDARRAHEQKLRRLAEWEAGSL